MYCIIESTFGFSVTKYPILPIYHVVIKYVYAYGRATLDFIIQLST